MNPLSIWQQPKRWGAAALTGAMLVQTVSPAFAAVAQTPGLYVPPPPPNVMFTLDDSGSMTSDVIPDFPSGLPNGSTNMWGSNSPYLTADYYKSTNATARYVRSSAGNPLYYDPKVTYTPWPRADNDQTLNDNANIAAVNISATDPFNTNRQIDLTTRRGSGSPDNEDNYWWPATYYVYNGTSPLPVADPSASTLNAAGNFTKWEIQPGVPAYPRAATRTDCAGAVGSTGCTYNEELQNFANWLQYYHSRMLMAKGGVATAFARQGTTLRVGFSTINTSGVLRQGVAAFSGTRRTTFYTDLYGRTASGTTPLRGAARAVGRYFDGSTTSWGNPWAANTSGSPSGSDACRKSFHILSTDGYWNETYNSTTPSGNQDTFSGNTPPAPDNTVYPYGDTATAGTYAARFSISPFQDNVTQNTTTLADIAAYYWKRDLNTTLNNTQAPSTRDPAYWQHLSMFTIGLGINGTGRVRPSNSGWSTQTADGKFFVADVDGSPFRAFAGQPWLADQDLRDLLVETRTPLTWTTASNNTATTGDDLIHAAMNARGRYFSATNPSDLANGLTSALNEVTSQVSSLANLAVATTSETSTDNKLFQATYNPSGWIGRLYAYSLQNGSFNTSNPNNAVWEVSRAMPSPADRNLYTWNPDATTPQGSLFSWDGLNPTQRDLLGPATGTGSTETERRNALDYLRGSATNEVQNGGVLRSRVRDTATAGVLGDIVNGSPVKGPDAGGGYNRLPITAPGQATYATYRTNNPATSTIGNMRSTLFFGANDGMLHAVNTDTGAERFGYVPNSIFTVPNTYYEGTTREVRKLYELTKPTYNHLYTVNGPPAIGDAFIGPTPDSADWTTVLLGSTGAGSRGVFAMDVKETSPTAATSPFGANKILWEFAEGPDPDHIDMGHVPNSPHIARMRDGTWVAMFGNGYDSRNHQARLYLVNLQTGVPIWSPTVTSPGAATNASAPNGLSQPNFVLNSNREVIAIYAGDRRGNMWKFDVSSDIRSNWNVAFGGQPLFSTPTNQPITVMPEISFQAAGTMILFGTGKYFHTEDTANDATNVNRSRQAIYGLLDNNGSTPIGDVLALTEQTISTASQNNFGATSNTSINWTTQRGWYMQLTASNSGERVHVNPIIQGSVLFVVANTYTNDPCSATGTSRLFALDPTTGGQPANAVFDINRSNSVTSDDAGFNILSISMGVLSLPRFLRSGGEPGVKVESEFSRGQTGANEGGVENKPNPCPGGGMGRLLAGISNTTTVNELIKVCGGSPRISWRQIR
jgi:type IV pilus assembly protein PilY1